MKVPAVKHIQLREKPVAAGDSVKLSQPVWWVVGQGDRQVWLVSVCQGEVADDLALSQ